MIATLRFKLPDDMDDFQVANNGFKWRLIVWELNQRLRDKMKYHDLKENEYEICEDIRNYIAELLGEHGLNLD